MMLTAALRCAVLYNLLSCAGCGFVLVSFLEDPFF